MEKELSIAESYSASIYMNDRLVKIHPNGQAEFFAANFNSHELATVAQIAQLLIRLRNKHDVEFEIQQDSFDDPNEIMRCYWTERVGILKNTGPATRSYNLIETIDEAISQKKGAIFCAKRSLVDKLPMYLPIFAGNIAIGAE